MHAANKKHVVIVGSSFAGFTVATELRERIGDRNDVTVISKSDEFLFMPSLAWVAFGLRARDHITFAVGPALAKHDVRFQHSEVRRIDLDRRLVTTRHGHVPYDYLVIATGSKPNYAAIPGLGPRGYTQSIMSLPEAERARKAFDGFLERPGPVVVGSVQGATCHVAAHEFLFAMACDLRARGLADQAPLTFLTGEPSLGHVGAGGFEAAEITEQFLTKLDIGAITGASIRAIGRDEIILADGRRLPFALAMLVPPSLGVDVVRACDRITNASGFVRVNDFCQTDAHPEVFAAGVAAASCTSFPEEMARVVAHNIGAHIRNGSMIGWPSQQRHAAGAPAPRATHGTWAG